MDFYSLSRKELQALCKKNKIPANITNIAMADALAALPQVEGLDEIMNPSEVVAGTPSIQHRTASRTSTQRKAVKEPESSKVSARLNRGKGTGVAERVVEQENKDANVSATPAMVPSSKKRVPAVSTRRKKEVVILDDGDDDKNGVQGKSMNVPKTPAVAPSSRKRATGRSVCNKNETPIGTSVQSQRAYSTRRSVRLLGKSLSEMSLVETEDMGLSKIDDVSEEMSSVSQDLEDSLDTEKGASLQTVSTVLSENTDELEVSSLNKEVNECQSHDSGSELNLVSVKENEAEDELQAEPEEEGSGNDNHAEAEPHDSSLNLQGSFDACDDDSIEAGSEQPELEDSCDSAELENKECNGTELSEEASLEIADQVDDSNEAEEEGSGNDNHAEAEPHDSSLNLQGSFDACDDDSIEAGSERPELEDSCDSAELENKECNGTELSEEASLEIADQVDDSNEAESEQPGVEESCDSAKLKNKECFGTERDEEASMEIAEQAIASLSVEASEDALSGEVTEEVEEACMEIADQDVAGLLCGSPVKDASLSLKELVEGNIDNQDSNEGDDDDQENNNDVEHLIAADGIQNFEPVHDDVAEQAADEKDLPSSELSQKGDDDNQEKNNETEHLNVADGNRIQNLEPMHDDVAEQPAADKKDMLSSEGVLEKDEGSGNSGAENEVCIESFADENESMETEHLNVADGNHFQNLEPMHDDVVEQPAADKKDMSSSEGVLVKDERSGNSGAENEVCIESFADEKESMEVEKVTHQLSLLGVAVHEAEDQKKYTSDKQEAEESEDGMRNPKMMKENFQEMSIRELKKELKKIVGKLNKKTSNDAGHMQEVEKKRTALQALSQNVLPTGEAQIDG